MTDSADVHSLDNAEVGESMMQLTNVTISGAKEVTVYTLLSMLFKIINSDLKECGFKPADEIEASVKFSPNIDTLDFWSTITVPEKTSGST